MPLPQKPENPFLGKSTSKLPERLNAATPEEDSWRTIAGNEPGNAQEAPTLEELLAQVDATFAESPKADRVEAIVDILTKLPAPTRQIELERLRADDPDETNLIEELLKERSATA